jgi:stringent starvation protein B
MSDGTASLPLKRDVALTILAKGSLFVHLDPRQPAVQVPSWLRQQPQLVLQVGYQMTIAINDLRVDDDCVFGTLSFSRTPFTCRVPWEAVFALVGDDGRGMVWPESMPIEIASEVEREANRAKRAAQERGPDAPQLVHSSTPDSDTRARQQTLTRIHEGHEHEGHERREDRAREDRADDALRATPLLSPVRAQVTPIKQPPRSTTSPKRRTALPPYLRIVK